MRNCVPKEMKEEKQMRQEKVNGYHTIQEGGMTRDLIPPRECGGWPNGDSTNLITFYSIVDTL